jgi:hypothetical protein
VCRCRVRCGSAQQRLLQQSTALRAEVRLARAPPRPTDLNDSIVVASRRPSAGPTRHRNYPASGLIGVHQAFEVKSGRPCGTILNSRRVECITRRSDPAQALLRHLKLTQRVHSQDRCRCACSRPELSDTMAPHTTNILACGIEECA